MNILGFNGEFLDPVLNDYHLNAYRAYNPILMSFTGPDDMSPFGKGGINPYVYCSGDPINRTDPTGHFNIFAEIMDKVNFITTNKITGTVFNALSIAASIALAVGTFGVGVPAIAGVALAGSLVTGIAGSLFGTAVKWDDNPADKKTLAIIGITLGIISSAFDVGGGIYGAATWMKNPANLEKLMTPMKLESNLAETVPQESITLSTISQEGTETLNDVTGPTFKDSSHWGHQFGQYIKASYSSKDAFVDKFAIAATLYMRITGVGGLTAAILANALPKEKAAVAGQIAVGIGEINSLMFSVIGARSALFYGANFGGGSYELNQEDISTNL